MENFPLLIRCGNKFQLIVSPKDIPLGSQFIVVKTNSSERELTLAQDCYALGEKHATDEMKK